MFVEINNYEQKNKNKKRTQRSQIKRYLNYVCAIY